MKTKFNFKGGFVETYFLPGQNLSEFELLKLQRKMCDFNLSSGISVKNRMLEKNLNVEEVKSFFNDCIISLMYLNENLEAFLVSPILKHKNHIILHVGLLLIHKNPGSNVIGLLGAQNTILAYQKFGSLYLTNITSTPSAVECFDFYCPSTWPSPRKNLKARPKQYENVIVTLKRDYIDKYFPDYSEIKINYKKFIMSSNSKEMGFKTNFYEMPWAPNYKYNVFCQSWINYENQEDLIQVAYFNFHHFLRLKLIQFGLKMIIRFKKNQSECEHSDTIVIEPPEEEKAVA